MNGGFGDDVGVQTVAKIDRVDVIAIMQGLVRSVGVLGRVPLPFQITVHDGEEDLQEEVDCIDEDGEQVQPRLARHLERNRSLTRL